MFSQRTRLLAAYFEGMFVNVCLPTTVGGDVLKVLRVGGHNTSGWRQAPLSLTRDGLAALFMLLATGLLVKFDHVGRVAGLLFGAVIVVSLPVSFWLLRYGISAINPDVRYGERYTGSSLGSCHRTCGTYWFMHPGLA